MLNGGTPDNHWQSRGGCSHSLTENRTVHDKRDSGSSTEFEDVEEDCTWL